MDLTVATANVEHARAPWRPLADVVGWQEADKPGWWLKVAGPRFRPTQPAALAVGITWRSGWTKVSATCERTHDGLAGVAPHRYVTRVILEKDGQRIGVLNHHATRPRGVRPARTHRADSWRNSLAVLSRHVGELRMAGIPVIVTGDFNRRPDDVNLPGLRCVWSAHKGGIDQIHYSPEFAVLAQRQGDADGSDHEPLIVTMRLGKPDPTPDPEVPVSDDRYDRVKFGDAGAPPKTLDKYTAAALEEAERRLGYTLTVVQGSYNGGGVSASAGTHDGGGAVDLTPFDHERKVRVLRSLGFAAWYRPTLPGVWNAHVHAILIGNAKLSPSAARQVDSYRRGRDGLKGDRPDPTWRPNPIPTFRYPEPPPPSRISVFRDQFGDLLTKAETLLDEVRPHIKRKERPAAFAMLAACTAAVVAARVALKNGPKA